jgi:hypothetical protein
MNRNANYEVGQGDYVHYWLEELRIMPPPPPPLADNMPGGLG